jgi:phenylacetate-CoA ligase
MQITNHQLSLVNNQIQALRSSGSFYGEKLREAGIERISDPTSLMRSPSRKKGPARRLSPGPDEAPEEKDRAHPLLLRHHGPALIIPYTAKDVDDWPHVRPVL